MDQIVSTTKFTSSLDIVNNGIFLSASNSSVEVVQEGTSGCFDEDVWKAMGETFDVPEKHLNSLNSSKEDIMGTASSSKLLYSDGFFNCDKCSRKIKRKDNFKRHYQQVHKLEYKDDIVKGNSKNKCIFPGCEEVFYHKSKMVDHLEETHKILVESETRKFSDFQEFLSWKEEEEITNFVWYPKKDERKISERFIYTSYVCQCNGLKESPQKTKKRKTVKKNVICPARMLVKADKINNEVTVKYIKSHNHKISCDSMEKKPIPKDVKEEITKKLLQNKSVDDVVSELHQEAMAGTSGSSSSSAIHKVFIQKQKIKYMQQKLNLPKDLCRNKVLIEDRLKALTSDEFNPILLYKPNEDTTKDWTIGNALNEEQHFMFGLQTKEQNMLFKTYAKHFVFLELANPTQHIPFYILTVKVVDDVMQAYNVAHLITNVCDDKIAQVFFNEIKERCRGDELCIHLVMTVLDTYALKPFQNVFGTNIQFIYSKWHFHKLLFSKLLADTPVEEGLRHQVYFTLVALIEQRDKEQFKIIASDFFHSYKSKCPSIVTFMAELYLQEPEKWALCYRDPNYHFCDRFMHINTANQMLQKSLGSLKDVCSLDALLHAILNIDQAVYLKQICKQRLSEISPSSHEISLTISDDDLTKVSDTQWILVNEGATNEINWNSDGCLEEFCSTRCLELVCFGLCQHMYVCSCRSESLDICPHIHKVHSVEMGVSQCQNSSDNDQPSVLLKQKHFRLYGQCSAIKPVNEKVNQRIKENLLLLQQYVIGGSLSQDMLSQIDETLNQLTKKCKTSTNPSKQYVPAL